MVQYNKKVVCLIPARGGSSGIPHKNLIELSRKPLLAHSIVAALGSKYITDVYVSTDDQEIGAVAKEWGSQVIKRPVAIAGDNSPSEEALLHFARQVNFGILVFLQCTSPLTTSADIDSALEYFIVGKHDSLLSVCEDRGGFLCGGFNWSAGRSQNYNYQKRPLRQQRKEKALRENGAIYIMTKPGLLKYKNRLFGRIGFYVMPHIHSFEIDEPEDVELLRYMYPYVINQRIDLLPKINGIKMLLFDVDGVFTDGTFYRDKEGKESVRFSRIDGKGIELLRNKGYIIGVISAEDSDIVRSRMEKLRIAEIFLGVKDKKKIYELLKKKYKLKDSNICFVGDDIQDIGVLKCAGLACCPANAQREVMALCDYVSTAGGGQGFVRDVCNLFL